MRFAVALAASYVTAGTALISYRAAEQGHVSLYGLSIVAGLSWIILVACMALAFRAKVLWAAPGALLLYPTSGLFALIAACSAGSTGCM